jgi:integrase/recombinase XerD
MHELLNGFRAELIREDRSPMTIASYANDVDLFGRWRQESYGESFDPIRVVQREISEYRSYLVNVRNASPATVNRRLASLTKFFGWLQASNVIRANPASGVKGIALVDPGVKAIDTASLRRLLREVHVHANNMHIAILEILSGTAIRVSELVALTLSDLELSERKGVLLVRSGKGRVARRVPMHVDVRKAVANWLDIRPTTTSNRLLIGQRGDGMTPSGIWRIVKRYAALAGVHEMTVHQLRHTALTRLVREFSVDLATCAKISGHRDLKTLLRYCAPTEQDVADAVDKLVLAGEYPRR